MKQKLPILSLGIIACCLPWPANAQQNAAPLPTQAKFGPHTHWNDITDVLITNLQGESLGRIQDLALDLTNGRIVEVLVGYGEFLRFGGVTIAVPPRALIPDANQKVFQINMSKEQFKEAPKFIFSKWAESTQPDRVAAAYRYFGLAPNFLVPGEATGPTTAKGRLLTSLGIVERMTKLMDMEVDDLKGAKLGRLKSLVLDVANGRILNTFVSVSRLGDSFTYQTVIPPMLLSFNARRDGLLLDVSKVPFANEPRVIFEDDSVGEVSSFVEQPTKGPRTDVALVQGTSFRDVNITSEIYQSMKDGKLDTFGVEVATLEGRVTLRGNVANPATKANIGAIAIGLVRLDNVDNQIQLMPQTAVLPPAQSSL
jgi:sporulation protein YlmC with PRC-barrel domain